MQLTPSRVGKYVPSITELPELSGNLFSGFIKHIQVSIAESINALFFIADNIEVSCGSNPPGLAGK
jgi:hypothetical protein